MQEAPNPGSSQDIQDTLDLLKEGGTKFVNFLLSKAIEIKSEIPVHFKDVLKIKNSDPKAFQEWVKAMEEEIQALCD